MALKITVNTNEEFEQRVNNQDIILSQAVVETILKNLKGKKRHIPTFNVFVLEDDAIYDLSIDRKDFLTNLEIHLPIMEKNEMFEKCAEMVKAINFLKK